MANRNKVRIVWLDGNVSMLGDIAVSLVDPCADKVLASSGPGLYVNPSQVRCLTITPLEDA